MPSNKINLLIIIHCHQPVGNFDWVFKEAYDKAYLPFIETLEKHPRIKIALHYSGSLLDWLMGKRPEFLDILKKLARSGQIELVSGGYYEPILPLISDNDKFGQLKMHMDFLKRRMGFEAKGAWLAERVWEPYLAKIFSKAGLKYTVVDDSHFELAGKKVEEILGYYLTEEEGLALAIFPSSKRLRYNMPFRLPNETIDYLRSVATADGARAVTFGDDGEKFGLWPHTYKWVYEEGWLESFFRALEENAEWLNIKTPSEYLASFEPLGRLYIPCASYPEMLEWSGGYFRNFLVKYPEANWMHKRMLYASEKLEKVKGERSKVKEAKEFLYKSQCNCAYWHGVFGGLYLHHLRAAVYKNIIDSENIREKSRGPLRIEILDIDKDGSDEVILENGPLAVYVSPRNGGSVLELDYRPRSLNLINTLARRPETYHKKITGLADNPSPHDRSDEVANIHDISLAKEGNLGEFLNYDRHRKSFMLDHFLSSGSNPIDFSKSAFKEAGDFVEALYKYSVKKGASGITLSLEREGMVSGLKGPAMLKVAKSLTVVPKRPLLTLCYRIKNLMEEEQDLWFGVEFNVSLRDPEFCQVGELMNLQNIELEDEWFKVFIRYAFNKNADLWFYPVETISGSEGGLERTYQGLCLLFHWRLNLKPKQTWSGDISMEIK